MATRKDVQLPVRVRRELLERIDVARGDVSRSRWVVRALEAALPSSDAGEVRREVARTIQRQWLEDRAASSPGDIEDTPLEFARVEAPVAVRPRPVPGVRRAREVESPALARQRELNRAKGL